MCQQFLLVEIHCMNSVWQQENSGSSKVQSEKKVSLRTVRQFMRLGKSKQQQSRRDSSTEDENR